MKVVISGGTGLVGKHLTQELLAKGHHVIILTRQVRNKNEGSTPQYVQWLNEDDHPETELEGIDAFINLAGASINGRWTSKYKHTIVNSRLEAANEMHRIIEKLTQKPEVIVNASAVGYYGTSFTKTFTEASPPGNDDFLSKTTILWEQAAKASSNIRTILCRFGVILDKEDGALPRMILPYKLFIGGTVGPGKQWISWIHIQDVVRAIVFLIENKHVEGPVNVCTPNPVTMVQFGKTSASILQKPHWLPVPSFALKGILGEMSMLVLKGQRVIPDTLQSSGFQFLYPELYDALDKIYNHSSV